MKSKILSQEDFYATFEFLRKNLETANNGNDENVTFRKVMVSHAAKLWKQTLSEVLDFDGFQGATVRR